ncbi:hypothetical protein BU16DRAFT_44971 [Lophium mytilinum]|uniref:C3H1-type domain-containing protein n=1 Tax=Lophium mytilinum TaxID=390894 RepID=A0A6A6QR94_9PEZI|nr:hypothetical protein BU16DRAFT_44971 [Lophium mytilinum]
MAPEKPSAAAKAPLKSVKKPFVLVLVDDHGKSFDENLIQAGDSGGNLAAEYLHAAVQERARKLPAGEYDIRVRVYANVAKLRELLGPGLSPSLDRFILSFNAFDTQFHYVDVGSTGRKIRQVKQIFEQSLKDSRCKHIFFLGGQPYVELLRSAIKATKRVTIVAPIYVKNGHPLRASASFAFEKVFPVPIQECWFYKMGSCKWGKDCKMFHPPPTQSPLPPDSGITPDRPNTPEPSSNPLDQRTLTSSNHSLPLPHTENSHLIPLNASAHRLDTLLQHSEKASLDALNANNSAQGNPCPDFHFRGACNAPTCLLDHSPSEVLDPKLLDAVRYRARTQQCEMGGACRQLTCMKGHALLTKDWKVVEWVIPDGYEEPTGMDGDAGDQKPQNQIDLLSDQDCSVEMPGEGHFPTWVSQGEDLMFFGDVEDGVDDGKNAEGFDQGMVRSEVAKVSGESVMVYDATMKFALSKKEADELVRVAKSMSCLDPPEW